MPSSRPKVLIACNEHIRKVYLRDDDLQRLAAFAEWEWLPSEGGVGFGPAEAADQVERLLQKVGEADGLVVCHGSPKVDENVLAHAPKLRVVGELEGDRFAYRIDTEAAWRRGVKTLDTTNGSSYPVAEWALALAIISLRNAGEQFRHMIAPESYSRHTSDFGYVHGELFGKKVGLIGCGHIGRRLISFLQPFHCDIRVTDPYIPPELPDVLDFLQTSLDVILADSDVVICLAPLTPATRGMLGARELNLLKPGSVFVNVSRGPIVDSAALIERLRRGDIVAGLDVFDPEPIPADHAVKSLPNVFLSPHIAGVTAATREAFFTLMVDELDRFFHGHETRYDLLPRTLANREGRTLGRS